MNYLDREKLEFCKNSMKKSSYNSLGTGMYNKNRLIHFEKVHVLDDKILVLLSEGLLICPWEYPESSTRLSSGWRSGQVMAAR